MEKLSCLPEHEKSLNMLKHYGFKAVELLGVNEITSVDTADNHTSRVGAASRCGSLRTIICRFKH